MWFKTVWNKLLCISRYILVPEMAVLVQVEPAGILCYAGFFFFFFFLYDVFWVENWRKKKGSMLHVKFLV